MNRQHLWIILPALALTALYAIAAGMKISSSDSIICFGTNSIPTRSTNEFVFGSTNDMTTVPGRITGGSFTGDGYGLSNVVSIPVTNGLVLYAHPKSGFTLNGTNITQWNDASGLGNHITAALATSPTLQMYGQSQFVHFGNYYDHTRFMTLPASLTASSTNCSVFMVLRTEYNEASMGYFQAGGLNPSLMSYGLSDNPVITIYNGGARATTDTPTSELTWIGMICTQTNNIVYKNNHVIVVDSANPSATWTGGVIGGFNSSMYLYGDVYAVIVFNRIISACEAVRLREWAAVNFDTGGNHDLVNIVCDGDSMTGGVASTNMAAAYPNLIVRPDWRVLNVGKSALKMTDITNVAAVKVDPHYDTNCPTYRNICIIWAGSNDLVLGDTNTTWTALSAYAAARRAAGWKVLAVTCLARSGSAAFETKRLGYNDLIRANAAQFDGIADVGADAVLGNLSSSTGALFDLDQTHPNQYGTEIVANHVRNALNRMLTPLTGNVGIATNAPSEKLEVLGSIKASGAYRNGLTVGSTTYIDANFRSQTNQVAGAMTFSYCTNGVHGVDSTTVRWLFNSSGSDQTLTFPIINTGVNGWRTNVFSPVPPAITNNTAVKVILDVGGPTDTLARQTNCFVEFKYYPM